MPGAKMIYLISNSNYSIANRMIGSGKVDST